MSATPQNLGNHRRYVPLYHYLLALLAGNLDGREEVKKKIREWRADDCRC